MDAAAHQSAMLRAGLKGGIAYALMTFAAGFVLGSIRIFAFVPHLGETAAVALEMPIMRAVLGRTERQVV
jgi:hypothetical protein